MGSREYSFLGVHVFMNDHTQSFSNDIRLRVSKSIDAASLQRLLLFLTIFCTVLQRLNHPKLINASDCGLVVFQ